MVELYQHGDGTRDDMTITVLVVGYGRLRSFTTTGGNDNDSTDENHRDG